MEAELVYGFVSTMMCVGTFLLKLAQFVDPKRKRK